MKKKTTIKRSVRRPPDPISLLWLQDQFDQLHRDHNLILLSIKKLGANISPELEEQINRASVLSHQIDEQVPDKNVPPGKTKRKKGK